MVCVCEGLCFLPNMSAYEGVGQRFRISTLLTLSNTGVENEGRTFQQRLQKIVGAKSFCFEASDIVKSGKLFNLPRSPSPSWLKSTLGLCVSHTQRSSLSSFPVTLRFMNGLSTFILLIHHLSLSFISSYIFFPYFPQTFGYLCYPLMLGGNDSHPFTGEILHLVFYMCKTEIFVRRVFVDLSSHFVTSSCSFSHPSMTQLKILVQSCWTGKRQP